MKNLMILPLIYAICLTSGNLIAQRINYAPSKNLSIHSFELKANLILLKGKVDNIEGWFILDTGMPDLILNQKYFQQGISQDKFLSLNGKTHNITKQIISFSLGILNYKKKEVVALDMPQLEARTRKKILGLIGLNILKNKEVMIDYDQSLVYFFKVDRKGNKLTTSSYFSSPTDIIPFKWKGHIPVIPLKWRQTNLRFGIDTGASINLLDNKHEDKVQPLNTPKIKLVSIGKTRSKTNYSSFNSISIAKKQYPPMQIAKYDLSALNRQLAGKKIDGILGYGFLSRQRVAINFKSRTVSLWREQKGKDTFYVNTKKPKIKNKMKD